MRYCLYILILTFGFSLVATAAAPLLDDPALDGWNTEVLSGEAGKQLEVFAGLLSQPDPIAAAQLEVPAASYARDSFSGRSDHGPATATSGGGNGESGGTDRRWSSRVAATAPALHSWLHPAR